MPKNNLEKSLYNYLDLPAERSYFLQLFLHLSKPRYINVCNNRDKILNVFTYA